jgi:hypothetical protein
MIQKLDKWHKTRLGLLAFALVELLVAYGFMSLSIDRGNFFYYLLTLIFLVGSLQNFVKLIGAFFHGKRQKR